MTDVQKLLDRAYANMTKANTLAVVVQDLLASGMNDLRTAYQLLEGKGEKTDA